MADSGGANPALLTLPDSQAALAPFPPGCPVLVSGSGDETSAAASPQAYLGQVHSVYIDLGSTTRDNFYRVRPSSAAATELRSAAESALKYAPGCTVTVDASALPPFVTEGGGEDTRDATIISCVGGGVSGSNNYYLLDVVPGPSDSWTNIQSTVPMDSVRYRAPVVEDNEPDQDGDQDNRAINNPHPHMIPADEDGSLNSSSKAPPVASIAFNSTASRKRPAQLDTDDGNSSTLSPMPTDGSISVASSNAIVDEIVRRIDVPDTIDASKVKGALVGPDCKINKRMQTKFRVSISILGLDDAVTSSVVESFSKLGPISYKVGDKCIMIQGSERRVHDAAKVVIHMLVNKCYDGKEKDTLMRKLRVVRQVRKKAEPSPPRASARPDLPSPTKKIKTGPTVAEGDAASLAIAAVKDPVERGWSPPIEDDSQPQIDSTGSAQSAQPVGHSQPHSCAETKLPTPVPHGNQLRTVLWAPIEKYPPNTDFFGPIMGIGGATLREVQRKYSVEISLRGIGIQSRDAASAKQKLHVIITGNSRIGVDGAAVHILKEWERTTKIVEIKSPVGLSLTYDLIIGDRGRKQQALVKKFNGKCLFGLRGSGVGGKNIVQHDDSSGPLRVVIQGSDESLIDEAATYVRRILEDRIEEDILHNDRKTKPRQLLPSVCQQLIMGKPSFDGQQWNIGVKSSLDPGWSGSKIPLSSTETFKRIIGEGGSKKRELTAMFKGLCFFCLRGDGIFDQTKMPTGGPLRVHINGPDLAAVESAAGHISKMLVSDIASIGPSSNPQRIENYGGHIQYEREGKHGKRVARFSEHLSHDELRLNQPFWNGAQWETAVESPIPEKTLFDVIVGPSGRNKKLLTQKFHLAYFTICGEGIYKKDGRCSNGPLRVCVQANDKDYTLRAARYISDLLDNVSGPHKYHRDNEHQCNYDSTPSRGTRQQMIEPYHDGKEWMISIRSQICEDTLFDTIIGRDSEKKREILSKFSNIFIFVTGGGIRGTDGRRDDGPLRVVIRGPRRDEVAAASNHVADLIDFRYHVDRIIEEPFLRGNKWHVKVVSPLPEQVLFDTIVGREGIVKKRLVEEHGGVFINLRGGGLKGDSYGHFHADHGPLHVDISSGGQEETQKIRSAANCIAKMLVSEAKRQRRL